MPPKSNLPQSSTNYTENQYQLRRHPVPTTPKRQRYSGRIRAMFLRSHDSDPVHPTRCPMTFALRRGVSANSARTCGSKASKLVALARRVGYFGGESEASARSTVFFAQPTSLAILRIDKPCPRRYRICAHCSKEITHPIFFGWATFRGAFWATFQRALTVLGSAPNLQGKN